MPVVAIGPASEFGSWRWIGADLGQSLANRFQVSEFANDVPACDIVVFVKFLPPLERLRAIAKRSLVMYCPVDCYSSCLNVDADWASLRLCGRIIVHCHRLRHYFRSYTKTEYLDHHLKFGTETPVDSADGPILWVGVHSNLPPLVDWVNDRNLPEELLVLTNRPEGVPFTPDGLGFSGRNKVRLKEWSPEAHLEALTHARAAIDIKGSDFRSRHKPPAKALDFIASGLPLAMNPDSSSVEHIADLGFEIATPDDPDYWLSPEYAQKTREFAAVIRPQLTREAVADRFAAIIDDVLATAGPRQ